MGWDQDIWNAFLGKAALRQAKKDFPDLPSDAEAIVRTPTDDDDRLWVDVLSNQYHDKTAKEYAAEYPDDEPQGEPVFAQYCLVSGELLQEHCPELYKKVIGLGE